MKGVFILEHLHEFENGQEDYKLIGVCSSYEETEKTGARVIKQAEFSDYSKSFIINLYILGFYTVN